MALSIEIRVPQAVIFDQETENKMEKNDQTGTQATSDLALHCLPVYTFRCIPTEYGNFCNLLITFANNMQC